MDATNNEKADVLKWMLGQIYRAEKRKKQLDERLVRIAEERDARDRLQEKGMEQQASS